jgi:erythromycin esterase-like protein
MKHRMIEFLVEEMGFTAVTLEAGFGDAAVLHDYVSICTSSATSASVMCPKNTIGTPTCTPI